MGAHKKLTFLVVALKTQVFLRDALFPQKVDDDLFLVIILNTQVFTVTMHKINYTLKRQVPQKYFSKRAPASTRRGGGRLWHNGQSKPVLDLYI